MPSPSSSKEELPILCEWDAITVVRNPNGDWICKAYAMRGPSGLMKNRVIPKKYADKIEKEYQNSINHPEIKYPKVKVIGRIRDNTLIPKSKHEAEVKAKKANNSSKKRKSKAIKNKTIKAKKKSMGGVFNPFDVV